MTSPNAYNVWPKSRQFEPDTPHAGRPECPGDRDFLASIPADIMLKFKRCPHLPGLIPVLILDRQPLDPHLETDTLRVGFYPPEVTPLLKALLMCH